MFVCLTQPVLELSYSRQLTYVTLQNIIIKYFWKNFSSDVRDIQIIIYNTNKHIKWHYVWSEWGYKQTDNDSGWNIL